MCIAALSLLTAASVSAEDRAEAKRPNILWIIAEDMGVELGCYGEKLVTTPNIDGLASGGIRYTNVIATAPVCSAARSALMTGMYQTTIGAHNHRSHRGDGYQLPTGVNVITRYFRDAGYFTANIRQFDGKIRGTGKTDWNFAHEPKPFDSDDWQDLKSHQPFFAQINFSETHRTFKKCPEHPIDPAEVTLPPYYPDHAVARDDWAMYLETVNVLDQKVGAVLDRLEQDGLADNTIVVFFSDHGRAHVRGKQWLYEGGVHIPLIVHFPDGRRAGEVNDDLIAHIDITATSMKLAGIERPENFEARAIVGDDYTPREYVVSARDRCDETVDHIRSVRTKRYKYIRNFDPERAYMQENAYKRRQYPVLTLLEQLHAAGKLTPVQELFMAEQRPEEELYDLQADPHEVHNLAGSAEHAKTLAQLRGALDAWIKRTGDKGQTPEDEETVRQQSGGKKPAKKAAKP
ncbi:MAG: sulfatase [Pirellulaceae bacterium]